MRYTVYHIVCTLLSALVLDLIGQTAQSQPTNVAAQRLLLEVTPVTRFAVSGDPGPLIVYLVPGTTSAREARDATSSYSMTANGERLKIVVSIDREMPRGMRLFIELASGRGTSSGRIDVSKARVPLAAVTGIHPGAESSRRITYTFSVDSTVDFDLLDSRIVTLTLTE